MKYFTVCNLSEEQNSAYRRYRSYNKGANAVDVWPALMFNEIQASPEDVKREVELLLRDPLVLTLFPGGAVTYTFVRNSNMYPIITAIGPDCPKPDDSTGDNEELIILGARGNIWRMNQKKRFDDCRSLFRHATGCAECPEAGAVCTLRSTALPEELRSQYGSIESFEKLTGKKIAEYEYVPPSATAEGDYFVGFWRSPGTHHFEGVEKYYQEASRRSQRAASSRHFKKTYCTNCVLTSYCDRWRHCRGPYPTEEETVRQTLDLWRPRIAKAFGVNEWKFWMVARKTAKEKKISHTHLAIGGWASDSDGTRFRIKVIRTRTNPGYVEWYEETYEEAAKLFDLPDHEVKGLGRPSDELTEAIYYLTFNASGMKIHGRWGSRPGVYAIWLAYDGVHVAPAWSRFIGREIDLTSIAKAWSYLEGLSIPGRTDVVRP